MVSISNFKKEFEHQLTRTGVEDGRKWLPEGQAPEDAKFHQFQNLFKAEILKDQQVAEGGKRNPWNLLGDDVDKELQRQFMQRLSLRDTSPQEAIEFARNKVSEMLKNVGDEMVAEHGEKNRFDLPEDFFEDGNQNPFDEQTRRDISALSAAEAN